MNKTAIMVRGGKALLGSELVARIGPRLAKAGAYALNGAALISLTNDVYQMFADGELAEEQIPQVIEMNVSKAGVDPNMQVDDGKSVLETIMDAFYGLAGSKTVPLVASKGSAELAAEQALCVVASSLGITVSRARDLLTAIEALRQLGALHLVVDPDGVYADGRFGHGFENPVLDEIAARAQRLKGVR